MEIIKQFYKNKTVLVTGASGFKGAWLCSWLLLLKSKVYGTGFNPNKNNNFFYKLNLDKKIDYKTFDIRNFKDLDQFVKKSRPEIIFHLAAQPLIYESYKKPYSTFEINCMGTLNILEIAKKYKFIKSLICVTSDKCYENQGFLKGYKENDKLGGVDPYSASKAAAEMMVRAYRKSFFNKGKTTRICGVSSARAGNVIGGGDWSDNRLLPDSIKALLKKKKIYIRNPNFNRPWQFVLEPLKGYLILAKKQYVEPSKFSGAWNFGTESKSITSVKKIVEYLINFWGSGKLRVKKENNFYEQHNLQLDIKKAKKILKWKPSYNIKDSVKVTTEWYYSVLKEKKSSTKVTNEQLLRYMNENKWY